MKNKQALQKDILYNLNRLKSITGKFIMYYFLNVYLMYKINNINNKF